MADFTSSDRQKAAEAIAQLLTSGEPAAALEAPVSVAALPDPKSIFCENWPIARSVLEALKLVLPKFAGLIDLIIGFGDKLHGTICG